METNDRKKMGKLQKALLAGWITLAGATALYMYNAKPVYENESKYEPVRVEYVNPLIELEQRKEEKRRFIENSQPTYEAKEGFLKGMIR